MYLWAGMLSPSDPLHNKLARTLAPMMTNAAQRVAPVELVDTNTLALRGEGSPGFSAALLPMFSNAKLSAALAAHRARVEREALQRPDAYYSDSLSLFGLGWLEERYRFAASGALSVSWKSSCRGVR